MHYGITISAVVDQLHVNSTCKNPANEGATRFCMKPTRPRKALKEWHRKQHQVSSHPEKSHIFLQLTTGMVRAEKYIIGVLTCSLLTQPGVPATLPE
jgi:hypothetical protein